MDSLREKEGYILNLLTEIYIFVMVLCFPLIVDKTGFFHIFECKWYSYLCIALTYLIIVFIVYLYFLIFKKINYFKGKKLHIIQIMIIIFMIINIVSCFISPYFSRYNLFIGVGRGEGVIMMLLYGLTFLCITFFGKFSKRYFLYFAVSSILISLVAILQYIGFNPFNMYQNGIGTHNVSFMSTIGNVDFLSSIYCIFLPLSFYCFIFLDDGFKNKIVYYLSIIMGTLIFSVIDVLSGKVAFLFIFVISLPFIVSNNKRLSNFLLMLTAVLGAYCINIIINPVYKYSINKLVLDFQFNYITLLFIIVIGILIYLSKVLKNINYDFRDNKKIIKGFYLFILVMGLFGILLLYFYKFDSGMLYEIHEILHGNFKDEFGTYRIFLWKRTFKIFGEYPYFGSGPDTFALRFMSKFRDDVALIGPVTINDTAANVYLTMLINIGVFGLVSYLLFVLFQVIFGIKNINKYSSIFLLTIICYLTQDFFNISLVITTPIFYLLMGVHYISLNDFLKSKKIKNW